MDRIPLSRAVPIYLAALIVAIAGSPLNIYDVHARGLGTEVFEPWRRRTCLSARVRSAVDRVLQILWPYRHPAAIACALLLVVALAPPSLHAHSLAVGVVAGQINVAQLESDLKTKQTAAKTLLETTMRTCADHVVKAATATEPEVKGRLMSKEEKEAIQAVLDEAKGLKARIEGASAEANMRAEIDRLTPGMT